MRFILEILVYPIVFIADGKVTNKFKRSFGTEQKFYSPERLECVGILLFTTTWTLFSVLVLFVRNWEFSDFWLNTGVWFIFNMHRVARVCQHQLSLLFYSVLCYINVRSKAGTSLPHQSSSSSAASQGAIVWPREQPTVTQDTPWARCLFWSRAVRSRDGQTADPVELAKSYLRWNRTTLRRSSSH